MGASMATISKFRAEDSYSDEEWDQVNTQNNANATVPIKSPRNKPTSNELDMKTWLQEHEKLLNDIIENTQDDKLKIQLNNFLKLIQASGGEPNRPPLNYFISNATYEGEALEESSRLNCRFEITILKEKWTCVKLFNTKVAVLSTSVTHYPSSEVVSYKEQDPFSIVPLIQQALPDTDKKSKKGSTQDISTSYCIGVHNNAHSLIASQAGTYIVDVTVLIPYATSRNTGFVIPVAKAAQNQVTFKVPEKDILIKVDPCLFSSQFQSEEKDKSNTVRWLSGMTGRFPPTSKLSIQWTENRGTNEEIVQKVETSAEVEQSLLISVGEGVVFVRNNVTYNIIQGSMSYFEVEIDGRLNVRQVDGVETSIKKWDVFDGQVVEETGNSETKEKKKKKKKSKSKTKVLKVWLEYGMEKSYTFIIDSELEMESTSCPVEIPSFNCKISQEIKKDKGYLAVEARTNVEIGEIQCTFLAPIDISEVPEKLYKQASSPLLFAYKFLDTSTSYTLVLDVKKHADIGVLIAVIDSAVFTATYSVEGAVLIKLLLMIRNTQKQYVRISIPNKDYDIWSTIVKGSAVKPAADDEGFLMIPLEKSSKSSHEDQVVYEVELIYHVKYDPLVGRGKLSLDFPYTDIPINQLFVSVYLPSTFKYGEFNGLREVRRFSRQPPSSTNKSDYDFGGARKDMKTKKHSRKAAPQMTQLHSNVLYNADSDEEYFEKEEARSGKSKNRGVLPVKVDMPLNGTEFKFEQLLVPAKHIRVDTEYKDMKKEYHHNHKSRGCCC